MIQGDASTTPERFAGLRVNHPAARGQETPRRRQDEVDDRVDEEEAEAHADRDAEHRLHDAFPELVQVLQKRHLSASLFIVFEIGLEGPRLRAWKLH
jgi:hypothetical protein